MNLVEVINNLFVVINAKFDFAFLWGGILALCSYPAYFFFSNLRKYSKDGRSRELFFQTVLLGLIVIIIGLVWALPDIIWLLDMRVSDPILKFIKVNVVTDTVAIIRAIGWSEIPSIGVNVGTGIVDEKRLADWSEFARMFAGIRWGVLFLVFFATAYLLGHEHGKSRWLISAVGHIGVILIGWLVNAWMGIFFISFPMIAAYYGALYSLAIVTLPASDPENRAEKKKRFFVLASYVWGAQSPITVVDSHAWKKYDPRISGDITWEFAEFPIPFLNKLQRPGLIWTKAHQVAAISGGVKFKRIDGPGVAFPGKLERLDQVFDLRLQIRSREIDVVSKDGIHFIARYFTAFRIDKDEWTKEMYDKIRPLNRLLRGADKLSHDKGSFPFSHARVQATLGITSTKVSEGTPLILWDQWVMNVIEDQVRKIISQKNLDEMWRPANDYKFANAMDIIANELKASSELILRASGVLLVASRVVNFKFPYADGQGDEIAKQQINTWGSEWERKRHGILDEAEAESERAQQEARAYAESLLLNSIAEGLQKTHEINPDLPRHVIAMRFLSSLQDYVHKEVPEEEDHHGEETERSSEKKKREKLARFFKEWQDSFFPGHGSEK